MKAFAGRWLATHRAFEMYAAGMLTPNGRRAGHNSLIMLTLVGIFGAVMAYVPSALAQDSTVRAQHGDWQVVCKPPPPGANNETCALVQSVIADDRNNVGLNVYFQKYADGKRILRVFAPLGVLLPPGLGLKIDNKDVGNAPFLRCSAIACFAQVVVDDGLIAKLKSGTTAMFIIFQTEEAGIGIPITLKGFEQGLAQLN